MNKNLNDLFTAIQGKAVVTAQGLMIKKSDLADINREMGFEDPKKGPRFRSFDEAKVAYKEDDKEWVKLAPPIPIIQQPLHPQPPSRA